MSGEVSIKVRGTPPGHPMALQAINALKETVSGYVTLKFYVHFYILDQ